MEVRNLNEVAILIDADFLGNLLINNYGFYRNLYPWKVIPYVNMLKLVSMIASHGRVNENGSRVDVIFYYNTAHPVLPFTSKYGNLETFLDSPLNDYHFKTDDGDFYIRSYFSDPEISQGDKEEFEREYMQDFREILMHVAATRSIRKIVLVADSKYLRDDLERYMESGRIQFFIERENSHLSNYFFDACYAGKYYFINANYAVANALGISLNEL